MRSKNLKPRLLLEKYGAERTLAVIEPNGKWLYLLPRDGFHSLKFSHEGHLYEVRRNSYPSEEDFSLYEYTHLSSTDYTKEVY